MRILCVPVRKLAGEVGGHGARTAGGKSHVVDDALPFAICAERFDVGRDGLQSGLVSGVHAVRGEVFDLAVHAAARAGRRVGLAEIEFEAVSLGESLERDSSKSPK